MEIIARASLNEISLPGRTLQKAVGSDSSISSDCMALGFATYSAKSGPMEPHAHAEESIYVLSAENAWVLHGPSPDCLGGKTMLSAGDILHFPENEWHVFQYGDGGSLDIIFFYGQVNNLRPEENNNCGK